MRFDLLKLFSSNQRSLDSLEDSLNHIDDFIFYHYTTFNSRRLDELKSGLRSLVDVINDKNSLLGSFLYDNGIFIDTSNLTLEFNNEIVELSSGGDIYINNLYQRLTDDYTISGFLINDFWANYSTISVSPEILSNLENVIRKELNYNINLRNSWKQKNFSTYQVKCLAPMDYSNRQLLENIKASLHNFTNPNRSYDEFLVTRISPNNIKVLDIQELQ